MKAIKLLSVLVIMLITASLVFTSCHGKQCKEEGKCKKEKCEKEGMADSTKSSCCKKDSTKVQ